MQNVGEDITEENRDNSEQMTLKTRKAFFNDKKASTMLLLALCTFLAGETNASLLDPGFIGKELQTFARDVLGVDEMQVYKN